MSKDKKEITLVGNETNHIVTLTTLSRLLNNKPIDILKWLRFCTDGYQAVGDVTYAVTIPNELKPRVVELVDSILVWPILVAMSDEHIMYATTEVTLPKVGTICIKMTHMLDGE